MTVRIKDILDVVNHIAPFRLAESWDNVGLLVGNPENEVATLLAGLDPSTTLLNEAIERGADTIITHHPIIFRPLPAINTSDPTGSFLQKALSHNINVIACHTNLDNAREGVSDCLAALLGLSNLRPLLPLENQPDVGSGRIGSYPQPLPTQPFLEKLFSALQLPAVNVAGTLPEQIRTVALCGGSGSEFAETALAQGADLYISAEIKHNTARWAEECNFCIIDGTHYATEQPAVTFLVNKLQDTFTQQKRPVSILQTTTEKNPLYQIYNHNS